MRQGRKSPAGSFSFLAIVFLILLFFSSSAKATPCEYHTVRRVIDGDTLVIDTGQRVRLIGIDTPEKGDRRRDVEFYAIEAMRFLKKAVEGKRVCLKKDPLHNSDRDEYGRLLRYIFVDNRFINRELIQDGYAYVFTSYPFVYIKEFKKAEAVARAKQIGIWNMDEKCRWQKHLIQAMKLSDTCGTDETICPWEAIEYIGKKVRVRMFVHRVLEGRDRIFIDSERDYRSPLNLRIVIPKYILKDPYIYVGEAIEVSGRVELYKDHPELQVTRIRLLK